MPKPETMIEGRHLRLLSIGGWEYVQRTVASGVVCIVAVTAEDKLILVEQFRRPVDAFVIELPAGLSGDADDRNESLETAAQRELLEETGYEANDWTCLGDVVSSAGLTDEVVTVFRARELRKVGLGGGDDSEDIIIHEVPLVDLADWIAASASAGKRIDSRVYGTATFLKM